MQIDTEDLMGPSAVEKCPKFLTKKVAKATRNKVLFSGTSTRKRDLFLGIKLSFPKVRH